MSQKSNIILITISSVVLAMSILYLYIHLIPKKQKTMLPFRSKMKMIAGAFRGGDNLYPENSIESFKQFEDQNKRYYKSLLIPMIKTEIMTTHDEHLICYAHKTLTPMTDEHNNIICKTSLQTLKSIPLVSMDKKKTGQIAELKETLEYCKNVWWTFEIIESGEQGIETARRTLGLLRRYKVESKTIMYSQCKKVNDFIKRNKSERLIIGTKPKSRLLFTHPTTYILAKHSKNYEMLFDYKDIKQKQYVPMAFIKKGHSVCIMDTYEKRMKPKFLKTMIKSDVTALITYNPEEVLNSWNKLKRYKRPE